MDEADRDIGEHTMASVTRQRRTEKKRPPTAEAQLIAALDRLLKRGAVFTEISVRQIYEQAGMSRATFYTYFRDKSDVLMRLSEGIRTEMLNRAKVWNPADGEDGARRYAEFFADIIGIHRQNFAVLSAVSELASYDSATNVFYTADLAAIEEVVRQTLVDQQQSGDTPQRVTAWAASRIIVWGGAQAITHHIAVDDGSGDAELATELGAIFWYGAYRRPSP
jgi:AcrR family transcriptional regulator